MISAVFTALRRLLRRLNTGGGLKSRLIRGGIGSAGIQAANRVLSLALGIVLARTLGAEGYGIYAYAFAIMSLLMILAEAGVPRLLMREVAVNQARRKWGLLRGILQWSAQLVVYAATAVATVGLVALWWWAERLSPSTLYTIGLMLLVLPLAALVKIVAHAMRGLHYVVVGQALEMLGRPILVLLIIPAFLLVAPDKWSPEGAMGAQLLAVILVLALGLFVLWRCLPRAVHETNGEYSYLTWIKSALPFTLIGGAAIINSQADIIMLAWFSAPADIGVYRVAVQGASIVALGLQATTAVAAPQFARLYALAEMSGMQRLVTNCARVIIVTALPFSVLLLLYGGAIAAWVFGEEFETSHYPIAILVLGQMATIGLGSFGYILNMSGYESENAKNLWFAVILNIILNLLLIPLYGMNGAATASTISLSSRSIFIYKLIRRRTGLQPCPLLG